MNNQADGKDSQDVADDFQDIYAVDLQKANNLLEQKFKEDDKLDISDEENLLSKPDSKLELSDEDNIFAKAQGIQE